MFELLFFIKIGRVAGPMRFVPNQIKTDCGIQIVLSLRPIRLNLTFYLQDCLPQGNTAPTRIQSGGGGSHEGQDIVPGCKLAINTYSKFLG